MAKGKDAAALFEVIHKSKTYRNPAGTSRGLSTPKWWWKRRRAPEPEPAPVDPGLAAEPVHDPTQLGTPTPHHMTEQIPAAVALEPEPAPQSTDAAMRLDDGRQEVTLRLSYTSAIVYSFAILITVVLAFLAGRRMYSTPLPAQAARPTEQMLIDPPAPQVLDVSSAVRSVEPGETLPPVEPISAAPVGGTALNAPQPPAPIVVRDARRQIGLNYVVIQSYPDEALAMEAVEALAQNGVQATIERGLRGWSKSWYSVVGIEGFSRISSAEFKDYVRRIDQISAQYAGKKSFKAFSPQAYKWDRES